MGADPMAALAAQERCDRARARKTGVQTAPEIQEGHSKESALRAEISGFCDAQWPKWVIMSPRPDVPSTLPVGAHDLTVFALHPLCILVELKSKTGKASSAQLIWRTRLAALGWVVHEARTMKEFLVAAGMDRKQ